MNIIFFKSFRGLAWLTMHRPCVANYTTRIKFVLKQISASFHSLTASWPYLYFFFYIFQDQNMVLTSIELAIDLNNWPE